MKILIVEDDRAVAQTLQTLLGSYHYAVDIAADGATGLEMVDAFTYDLVLLDIWLPGLDGLSMCQRLRAKGSDMPILMLTAQAGAQEKATALNAGADDYVVKPFEPKELMARVQALLRRGGPQAQPQLRWEELSLNPSSRSVAYDEQPLHLTPKEYGILELFLRHPQQVFSAGIILDRVWHSEDSPGDEAVRVHIKDLRKKLKAAGAPKDFIETLQRLGYRLNPLYSKESTASPNGASTVAPIAELRSVNAALQTRFNSAHSSQAELDHLRVRNEELERRVAELSAALAEVDRQRQPRDAERQSQDQVQQARRLAHELNNAFTPMLAIAQLIRLTQPGLDATTQERLQGLKENIKRSASLVKEILALICDMTESSDPRGLDATIQNSNVLTPPLPRDDSLQEGK